MSPQFRLFSLLHKSWNGNKLRCKGLVFVNVMAPDYWFSSPSEKIYFDRYLPPTKRETRIKRLEASFKALAKYRKGKQLEQSAKCKKTWNGKPSPKPAVFQAGSPTTSNTFRSLPPAPFLVSAVLDALITSKYGAVIHTVPGEAETYCALAARHCGNTPIILSDDSDLFHYDLGPTGNFVYLSTTELRPFTAEERPSERPETCETIKFEVFQSQDIAKRLGVELREIAFQFSQNPSQTLPQAIKAAKEKEGRQQADLNNFLDQYVEPSVTKTRHATPNSSTQTAHHLQFLDPRMSELVVQLEESGNEAIEVYLLFLIEDLSRASAWSVSWSQRAFAYSLCALNHEGFNDIVECNRRGSIYMRQKIPLLPQASVFESATNLQEQIDSYRQTFSDLANPLNWRTFALSEVYKWYLDTAKTP